MLDNRPKTRAELAGLLAQARTQADDRRIHLFVHRRDTPDKSIELFAVPVLLDELCGMFVREGWVYERLLAEIKLGGALWVYDADISALLDADVREKLPSANQVIKT